jgi:hypothetical protein
MSTAGEKGEWEVTAKGYKFSFGNDENIIELGEW